MTDLEVEKRNNVKTQIIPQKSHKVFWNHENTQILIDEYVARFELFQNPCVKKSLLWQSISNVMLQKNYNIPPRIIDKKFCNLRRTYRAIKESAAKRERKTMWPYYSRFDDLFRYETRMMQSRCSPIDVKYETQEELQPTEFVGVDDHEDYEEDSNSSELESVVVNPAANKRSRSESQPLPKLTPRPTRQERPPTRKPRGLMLDGYRKRKLDFQKEALKLKREQLAIDLEKCEIFHKLVGKIDESNRINREIFKKLSENGNIVLVNEN